MYLENYLYNLGAGVLIHYMYEIQSLTHNAQTSRTLASKTWR